MGRAEEGKLIRRVYPKVLQKYILNSSDDFLSSDEYEKKTKVSERTIK